MDGHDSNSQQRTQVVFTYRMPASVAKRPGSCSKIGIAEITGQDEIDAAKRAQGDIARLAMELTKCAVVQADGKPVSYHDASVDRLWEALGPQGRRLVMSAYGQVNNPEEKDGDGFLASRAVEVG